MQVAPDEPDPPVAGAGVRAAAAAGRPRLHGVRHPGDRRVLGTGRRASPRLHAALHGRQDDARTAVPAAAADLKYRAKPFIDVTMDRFAKGDGGAPGARADQAMGARPRLASPELRQHLDDRCSGSRWRWSRVKDYLDSFRAGIGERAIAPTRSGSTWTMRPRSRRWSRSSRTRMKRPCCTPSTCWRRSTSRNLITPLLLHHESPRVRARALHSLATARSRVAARWAGAIERLIHDDDVDVRAGALRALAALSQEDAVGTAAASSRRSRAARRRRGGNRPGALAGRDRQRRGRATLKRLADDTRDAGVPGRREVAAALGAHRRPAIPAAPRAAALRPRHRVVRDAISSARSMGASDGLFLPGLISLLGHRVLKAEPRETRSSDTARRSSPALAHALSDQREHVWIRRHVPATLARMPTQASMDALVGVSRGSPTVFCRYKAIAAIERLRRDYPDIVFPRAVDRDAGRARSVAVLQLPDAAAQPVAARRRPPDRCSTARSTTSSRARSIASTGCVGLLYNIDDVAAARYTIEQGEKHAPRGGGRVPRQPAGRRGSQTGAADPRGHADRRKGAVTRTWS